MKIRVIGPKDRKLITEKNPKRIIFNVTSSSPDWTKSFSPFLLGPVKLYGPYGAFNVENAYQYSKVYAGQEYNGEPSDVYWDFALEGWANKKAVRYPMGKGIEPLYTLWDGEKLSYIEARKKVYIPLYQEAVYNCGYFDSLVAIVKSHLQIGNEVCFWDYDGYDSFKPKVTFKEAVNNPNKILGHAFVLANMVEAEL